MCVMRWPIFFFFKKRESIIRKKKKIGKNQIDFVFEEIPNIPLMYEHAMVSMNDGKMS